MYSHIVISLDSASLATEVIQDLPYLRKSIVWTASNAFNVVQELFEEAKEALTENGIDFIVPHAPRDGDLYS